MVVGSGVACIHVSYTWVQQIRSVSLPSLVPRLRQRGHVCEYLSTFEELMAEGLRRSARKKQLSLKAELNVVSHQRYADWRSERGSHRSDTKEPDHSSSRHMRRQWNPSHQSRDGKDLSEEEEEEEEEEEKEEEEEEEEEEEMVTSFSTHQPKRPSKVKQTKRAKHSKVEHKQPPPEGRKPVTRKMDQKKQQSQDGAAGEKELGHRGGVTCPDLPPGSGETDESDMETAVEAPSTMEMGEAREGEGGGELPTEGCWRHFSDLCEMLPGRRPQIELLLTLFGEVSGHIVAQ